MSGVISSIVTIDIEKFRRMTPKELHQQPEQDVLDAANYFNRMAGGFYSDEILKGNAYNALIVLRSLKL